MAEQKAAVAEDPKRLAGPEDAERYFLEVQHYDGGPWASPSVGGIENGFATPIGAEDLQAVLMKHDGGYYAWSKWRIVKVSREVVAETPAKRVG